MTKQTMHAFIETYMMPGWPAEAGGRRPPTKDEVLGDGLPPEGGVNFIGGTRSHGYNIAGMDVSYGSADEVGEAIEREGIHPIEWSRSFLPGMKFSAWVFARIDGVLFVHRAEDLARLDPEGGWTVPEMPR